MDFSIVPVVGDAPLLSEQITVRVTFTEHVKALVESARKIDDNVDKSEAELDALNDVQKNIQSALNEIKAENERAKQPIRAVLNRITDEVLKVSEPLQAEKSRLNNIVAAIAERETQRREAEIRAAHEAKRRAIAEREAELLRIQEEKQKLEIAARGSDLFEAKELRAQADELKEEERDAKLGVYFAQESEVIEPKFSGPLVRGQRIHRDHKIDLVNETAFLSQDPAQIKRFATVVLRIQSIKDEIKTLLRDNHTMPDIIEGFLKIGVMIEPYMSPRQRASAKVVRELK